MVLLSLFMSGCVSDHDPADHDPDHSQDHDLAELSRDPDPDLILSGRLSRDPTRHDVWHIKPMCRISPCVSHRV